MTQKKDTKVDLKEISEFIYEQVKRAYRLGYSDGVEDALNAVKDKEEKKKKLSQPWQS